MAFSSLYAAAALTSLLIFLLFPTICIELTTFRHWKMSKK